MKVCGRKWGGLGACFVKPPVVVCGVLGGLVEGGADLLDVGSVDADGFVELFAGDVELVGPVSDVGGHLWVDLFGVVRRLDVRALVTVVVWVDGVVVDGLGAGDDGVFGIGDVLDGAIAVVVDVGHLVPLSSVYRN